MAFPSNPSLNELYPTTVDPGERQWIWNGYAWDTVSGASGVYVGTTELQFNNSPTPQHLTGILSIDGLAASATALATARTINGTAFNGTANITTANWGTGRTLTIGATGKSVNGSANVSWSLAEIGAASTAQGALADTAVQPGDLADYVPWSDVSVAQSNDTVVQRNATGGIEAGRGSVFNQGDVVNSPLMTWTNIGAGTSGISFAAASGGTGALATTLDHQFSFSSQNLGGYLFGITGSGKPKTTLGAFRITMDANANTAFASVIQTTNETISHYRAAKNDNTTVFEILANGGLRFDGELKPSNDAGTTGQVLTSQGAGNAPIWAAAGGVGTVTSVAATVPTGFSVSGSPITSSGTIAITYAAGYQGFTTAESSKLAGIATGAQVNVATNLAQGTRTTTTVPITSSTGTGATLAAATTSLAGVMSSADKTKLDGIATGATVGADWSTNLTGIPANITAWAGIAPSAKADASHTHTIANVIGLQGALDDKVNKTGDTITGVLNIIPSSRNDLALAVRNADAAHNGAAPYAYIGLGVGGAGDYDEFGKIFYYHRDIGLVDGARIDTYGWWFRGSVSSSNGFAVHIGSQGNIPFVKWLDGPVGYRPGGTLQLGNTYAYDWYPGTNNLDLIMGGNVTTQDSKMRVMRLSDSKVFLELNEAGYLKISGQFRPGTFVTSAAPVTPDAGSTVYLTDAKKIGETTGTGVPVYYSEGTWRRYSDDAAVGTDPIAKEPAFSKGSLVAGAGVSLSGTLTDRLVGSGNITITATSSGTVTSVNLANSTGLTASGGPVTGAGSLTYTLSANLQAWHALATNSKQDTLTSSTSNTISGTQVQRAALTGDVTAAANANATTISNSVVTNAKLANVATATIKGRVSASTGVVEDLTAAQVRTLLNVADGATANTGTVTSVGLSVPTGLQVSGSPVTTSGTLAVTYASGYQGYTSAEATKLGGIAAGATVGATWGTNLASIPANITSWAGIAPSAKQDALGFTPVNKAGDTMTGALTAPAITSNGNLTGSEIYCNNWIRSNTSGAGWYHQAHAGGWYMADNNWIRNYNGKGLYLHHDSDSQLVLSGSSPTIKFVDTDGGNQWLHNNEGQIGFLQNNTYAWSSYRDGSNNWCSTGNVIAYASDARLKKNVSPVSSSAVDKFFDEFQVEEFDWDYDAIKELNDGFHPSADHEVGAIAQKVEEVLPSMVYTHKHSGIKTLDWDKTIPYLIAEIQSLRKRLTKLERNE